MDALGRKTGPVAGPRGFEPGPTPPPAPGIVVPRETCAEEDLLVARARAGDVTAFDALILLVGGRVYRTLLAITGNSADAEDAAQNTFLKAFRHLGEFQSGARFSTWIIRIAINEGVDALRRRRPDRSLDEPDEDLNRFRPRQIRAWYDNPEEEYSRSEIVRLVEQEVLKLPDLYRVALILRDLEQLPTEEAAKALGLQVPALKARLLRGRLMLREALAPHFGRWSREDQRD